MPKTARVFAPVPECRPAALLYLRHVGRPVWSIVPALGPSASVEAVRWHLTTLMMGGNFAHTSDSRLGQITGMYGAVAIHDRTER